MLIFDCDKHLNLHGSQIPSAVVRQCEPICTKRRQSETQNDFDENTHRHKIPTFDDNERTTCQTIRDMAEQNVPGPSTGFNNPSVSEEPHKWVPYLFVLKSCI